MNRKKIVALIMVVALALTTLVGGTLAYFTDTDDATNVFTMGNVDIELDEAPVIKDGYNYVPDTEEDRVQHNEYENLWPGQVIPKDPVITNVGSTDAWIRAKIQTTTKELATIVDLQPGENVLTEEAIKKAVNIQAGWTYAGYEVVSTDGENQTVNFIFTYDYIVEPQQEVTLFTEVTIDKDVEDQGFSFNIDVKAEAIQTPGLETVVEAWNAFDGVEELPAA